ncbi:MAG: sialidase family protein, partial [Pseudomonadales bacterium]
DCCQTDVALASTGPIAVYRNRTMAEIRDIYVARHREGRWQAGEVVADDGWEISGCPVNGPAITAKDRAVGVAWFTAASGHSRVRVALSTDAGATFTNPVDIDTERAIGRVDVAMLDDGALAVSWLRRGLASLGEIVVRRVAQDGTLGSIIVIAKTVTFRPTGFPQMVRDEEALLFAWTHIEDGQTTIRTARLNLSVLNTQ